MILRLSKNDMRVLLWGLNEAIEYWYSFVDAHASQYGIRCDDLAAGRALGRRRIAMLTRVMNRIIAQSNESASTSSNTRKPPAEAASRSA